LDFNFRLVGRRSITNTDTGFNSKEFGQLCTSNNIIVNLNKRKAKNIDKHYLAFTLILIRNKTNHFKELQ